MGFNDATESTLKHLSVVSEVIETNTTPFAITEEITVTAYDLQAASYLGSTNITQDYMLVSVEFVFTTAEEKTIRVLSPLGADLIQPYTTTDTTWFPVFNTDFNANKNITITATQTAGACLMSMTLRVKGRGASTMVSSSWKDPVANSAALPLTGIDGDARVTIDTGDVWIWYGGTWHNKTNPIGDVYFSIDSRIVFKTGVGLVAQIDTGGGNWEDNSALIAGIGL